MPIFLLKMAFLAPLPPRWHQDSPSRGKRLIRQFWWLLRPLAALALLLLCVTLAMPLGGCAYCHPSVSLRMPPTATLPSLTPSGLAGVINDVGESCEFRY